MAVPQVGGTITQRAGSLTASINISSVPTGAWMLLSAMALTPMNSITPPAGWSTLHAGETTGTRRNFLFAKVKESSDGSTAVFNAATTNIVGYALLWGTGGTAVNTWVVGTTQVRQLSGESAGARYTNIAPGITTTANNSLAIAISHEATNTKSQPLEVASTTPTGWTQRLWHEQETGGIETAWMGTKEMATIGTTGDLSIRYVSPQDFNGWGIQVAIPGEVPAPVTSPVVVGTPTTFSTGAAVTAFTIDRPAGIAVEDYIVIAIRHQSSVVTAITAPAGFTRLGPAFVPSTNERALGFYGKPVTDVQAEPTTYDFSFTTASPGRAVATAFIVRGVDSANPVAGFHAEYAGTSIPSGRSTQPYALTSAPALALFMGAAEFTTPYNHIPLTYPSGYTALVQAQTSSNTSISRTSLWVGTQKVEEFTVPAGQMTWDTPAGYAVESIALRGSNTPPPAPEGPGLTLANGSGQEVKAFYTTADGPRTPSRVVPLRRGFNSVTEMLATPGFTWAHRGGSLSYPEHSLYGYTQSMVRGYGVFEVSLGRTSDGVWFALHDQTTDRTSGGTFGNASDQTWAQIQAQQIVVGPGAPQPYLRWSELVEKYGSTHVFVTDSKYAWAHEAEYLNMVLNDIGPERAIIKTFGPTSGGASASHAAQALGFKTWGYFYATDASVALGGNGALQTYGAEYDIIGMDYTASQAVWNEALAIGRPIVAHIVPNQAAYNTAMAKGAIGAQVSGVGSVAPVSWWTQ